MKKRPNGAFVFVRNSVGILLVHHNYGQKFWSLPGGAVEPGEEPKETVLREVLEETGLSIKITRHLGTFNYRQKDKKDPTKVFLSKVFLYAGEIVGGTCTCGAPDSEEIQEVSFLDWEEIERIGFGPGKVSVVQSHLIRLALNHTDSFPVEGKLSVEGIIF